MDKGHSLRKKKKIANKHIKRRSTSTGIEEMQTKTQLIFFKSVRQEKIKSLIISS